MSALEETLASVDWSTPEGWRTALTAYGNALLTACEQGAALKARFAQLAASADHDAIAHGLKEVLGDLPDLIAIADHLEEHYAACHEYLDMVASTRKPAEG